MDEKKTLSLDEAQELAAKIKYGRPLDIATSPKRAPDNNTLTIETAENAAEEEQPRASKHHHLRRVLQWFPRLSFERTVTLCGVGMVVIGLFPPWVAHLERFGVTRDMGYAFIGRPPQLETSNFARIDLERLFVEWIIGAMASTVILFLKRQGK